MLPFYFRRQEKVEITIAYTYLEVQFTVSAVNLKSTSQPRVCKGYTSLAVLKVQGWHFFGHVEEAMFSASFQYILSRVKLFGTLIKPTVLYGLSHFALRLISRLLHIFTE